MVGTIDDLERLGLVSRKPDPADRRAYRVELTPRGRTTLVRATGAVAATAERSLLAPLNPEEQATVRTLLRRLTGPSPGAPAQSSADTPPEATANTSE
jgi:DNA-binding MarR family transcriptional regulator